MNRLTKIKQYFLAVFTEGQLRQLNNRKLQFLIFIGFLMSSYQIWSVIFGKLDAINQMSIHLAFILILTFFSYDFSKRIKQSKFLITIDVISIILALSAGLYYAFHAERIATRTVGVDLLTGWDIFFGLIFVLLSIEAARRTIGFAIVAVALIFIAYTFFGHLLEGILHHHKMSFTEIIDQLAYSYNGLWASPIAVAASFVFIFILFGAFLKKSGAGEFFFQLSVAIAGRTRGGPAKIAVIASSFFGTVSGSPTANVVTTGPFTIPMAKRIGYSPRFAAAVEACASTGSSLLPPIMGSSAFLMAAVSGIPYSQIVLAAILPAVLYYVSLFMVVHFEAVRLNLPRAAKKDIPNLKKTFKNGWYYFIPVILLIVLLFKGMSPSRTGVFGIIAIIIVSWFKKETRMGPTKIIQAMADGARAAIPISTACATAGLVIAGMMTTGLGGKLNSIILNITAGELFPSLVLIMIMCIILGMGMPVAAAYVLTAMLAAPTLINLGVSPLAAHLFIVYFSIISAITPPVAVAAFAAAGIARTNPTKAGFEAVRLGIASFIIPFIFIYKPALLLDGAIYEIFYNTLTTALGLILLGSSLIGAFFHKLSWPIRGTFFGLSFMIIYESIIVNIIGLIATIFIFNLQYRHKQKHHYIEKIN